MKRFFAAIFLVLCLSPVLTSCGKQNVRASLSDTKFLLDTSCTISLYDRQDKGVLDAAFRLCSRYENLLSTTVKGSDIYRINHAGGKPVKVDRDTMEVLREGIEYGKVSGGAFDITIGALSTLWNFDAEHPRVPDQAKIESARKTVDYRKIALSGDTVTLKDKNASIDLGAIAKGYIADKLKDYLVSKGVHRAIINLGGNVVVIGEKAKNTPWVVGVQQPFMERNEDVGYVYVCDKSVVTSGIYERYFVERGRLYEHILDPSTGYPVDNNLSSVTIISDRSVDGDGLSTTCFLLGIEKAEKLIESLTDVEAVFITKDGKVITTPGINQKIKYVPAGRLR